MLFTVPRYAVGRVCVYFYFKYDIVVLKNEKKKNLRLFHRRLNVQLDLKQDKAKQLQTLLLNMTQYV